MKDKIVFFSVLLVFISFGFMGCAKKAVRTDVGVEFAEKEAPAFEEFAVEGEAPVAVEEPVEEVKAPEPVEEVKAPEPVEEVRAPEPVEEVKAPEPVEEVRPEFGEMAVKGKEPVEEAVAEAPAMKRPLEFQDVFFDYDRYEIRADAVEALKKNAELMMDNPHIRITIEGHCDERGTVEYNIALGERRAMAVKKYLRDLGVEPDRMSIISYGKERPFCFEHNEQCWQLNRRGHFVIR